MPAHSVAGALPKENGREAAAAVVTEDFVEGRGSHCVTQGGQLRGELLSDTKYKCLSHHFYF